MKNTNKTVRIYSVDNSFSRSTRTYNFILILLVLAAITVIYSCQARDPLVPGAILRAASIDSMHIILGFDEALDPVNAASKSHYSVTLKENTLVTASIDSVSVENLYGQTIKLRFMSPLPDSSAWLISVDGVSYLNGLQIRDEKIQTDLITGLSYEKDMALLFQERCNKCHGISNRSGNYTTTVYDSLFGTGTNSISNCIPKNPNCALVYKVQPKGASYPERSFPTGGKCFSSANLAYYEAQMIYNWVVNYMARR